MSLAKMRKTCDQFDAMALSSEGFMVKCADKNVELPGGELVADGTAFRDDFHFWVRKGSIYVYFVLCVQAASG